MRQGQPAAIPTAKKQAKKEKPAQASALPSLLRAAPATQLCSQSHAFDAPMPCPAHYKALFEHQKFRIGLLPNS
jgi:hypothetical protein